MAPSCSGWRIGPYLLTRAGDLSLAGLRVPMQPLQQRLLLIFVQAPHQVLRRDELLEKLWPEPSQRQSRSPRALTLAVHRLRQIFASGPLGIDVIRSVYGKGYCLEVSVLPLKQSEGQDLLAATSSDASGPAPPSTKNQSLAQAYYREARDHWPRRDPYDLPRHQWLLQQCLASDPDFINAHIDLSCHLLLQCLWGVRPATSILSDIERTRLKMDSLATPPLAWSGIHAEVLTMLFWQPQISLQLYGDWLATSLPPGMPLFAWTRHLIFSGQPQTAVIVLESIVKPDLRQGWLLLSLAYAALGKLDSAIEAAHRQLQLDPALIGTRLFLAMLKAFAGDARTATRLIQATDLLERPFQGSLALACYALAHGPLQGQAQQLLDEALIRVDQQPEQAGAPGYWGLAALVLERSAEAMRLLSLTVRQRCYSGPVLLATPFLRPFGRHPVYQNFQRQMQISFPLP